MKCYSDVMKYSKNLVTKNYKCYRLNTFVSQLLRKNILLLAYINNRMKHAKIRSKKHETYVFALHAYKTIFYFESFNVIIKYIFCFTEIKFIYFICI